MNMLQLVGGGLLVFRVLHVLQELDQYGGADQLQLTNDPAHNKRVLEPFVREAAQVYGIPFRLYQRLLEKESGWRLDVINGDTISSAGAIGIAQIVPKWHPNVNYLDPVEAINYGAYFLSEMYRKYGSWEYALAAYNWGQGNLDKYGYASRPTETRNYIAYILA